MRPGLWFSVIQGPILPHFLPLIAMAPHLPMTSQLIQTHLSSQANLGRARVHINQV